MQPFDISRKRLSPFWNRKITQVKNKLKKYVNESQWTQAVMKKTHTQLSMYRGDYGTSETATRAWKPSGGAEDTDIRESDIPHLERRSFWSGRLHEHSDSKDERAEHKNYQVRD